MLVCLVSPTPSADQRGYYRFGAGMEPAVLAEAAELCTLIRQRQGDAFLDTVYCHPIAATAIPAKLLELRPGDRLAGLFHTLCATLVEIPAQLGDPDCCSKLLEKVVARAIGCRLQAVSNTTSLPLRDLFDFMTAEPGAVGDVKVAPPGGDGVVEATGVCTLPRAVASLEDTEAKEEYDTLIAADSSPSWNDWGARA